MVERQNLKYIEFLGLGCLPIVQGIPVETKSRSLSGSASAGGKNIGGLPKIRCSFGGI